MITYNEVASASPSQLAEFHQQLTLDRMKMDKDFSIFLDTHELSEVDVKTPSWDQYKQMLTEYQNIRTMLFTTEYYMKKANER